MIFSAKSLIRLLLPLALGVAVGSSSVLGQNLRGLSETLEAAVVVDGAIVGLTETGPIIRSIDGGANFHTLRSSTPPDTFHALAAAGRVLVAGGSSGLLLRSDFNVAPTVWNQVSSGLILGPVRGLAHDGSGKWVAVGQNGFGGGVLVSTNNGVQWTRVAAGPSVPLFAVAWHAGSSKWIAVGGDGFDGAVFTSSNGTTWTQIAVPAGTGTLLALGVDATGNILAVGEGGAMVASSNGAASFSAVAGVDVSEDLRSVVSAGSNQWVVGGESGVALSIGSGGASFLFEPDPSQAPLHSLLSVEGSIVFPGREFTPPPVFTPGGGTFAGPVSVTLSGAAGLPVFYTLDGSLPSVSSTPFTGPFQIGSSLRVRAVAWDASVGIYSPVASAFYLIESAPAPLAAPTITPNGGSFTGSATVAMSADPGVSIYYTINGSAPTTSSLLYTGLITLSASGTVRAVAWDWGRAIYSPESSATFTVIPAAPTFSPAPGTYVGEATVTISAAAGTGVHFTLDGTTPGITSPLYTGPIVLTSTTVVRAVAVNQGNVSSVASATYTIAPFAPQISPPPGTYVGPTLISISAQAGATIHFTTDGTEPTSLSPTYSTPFSLTAPGTVKAMARLNGVNGPVATSTYVIAPLPPQIAPAAGTYVGSVSVTVTAEAGAEIFYTLDGSLPTAGSTLYTGPVNVTSSATFRAVARRHGVFSSVTSVAYTVAPSPPQFSPVAGTYVGPTMVTLSAQAGSVIYYTLDGSTPTTSSLLYISPFTVSTSRTVRAIARANGVSSPVASAAYVIAPFAPEIAPAAGTYVGAAQITLTAQPGATIYFTLNGSEPTTSSTVYSAPFNLTASATVRAMARLNGVNGPVASSSFVIAPPAPVISPAAGTHVGPISVTMSAQAGATIYFTTDGSEPTTSSAIYVGAFPVSTSSTVRAMARFNGVNGPIASSAFVIAPFAPTITPAAGTHVGPISVTLSAQAGATIFYTTDGSEPTQSSTVYTGAFTVSTSATVRAMARLNGVNGPIASASYVIAPFAPSFAPAAGTYVGPTQVTLSAQPGATIFYTVNGTEPTTSSLVYSGPITMTTSTNVRAMARLNGVNGPVSSASYVIAPFAPQISPDAGSYVGLVTVSLTAQTGATIFFTLDGSEPTTTSAIYSAPFNLSAPTTVRAMARLNGVNGPVATSAFVVAPVAPVITPASGTYVGSVQVSIAAAAGATIHFTTDGSQPTQSSAVYSAPLTLTASANVRAIARAHGVSSAVASANYVIAPLAPVISPAPGTYVGSVSVSLSAQLGATIYFTTDGSEPTTASTIYSAPVVLTSSATVRAMARLNGVNGPVSSAAFTVAPNTPVFSVPAGTYVGPISVTISAQPGATIYFTLDGSEPTTSSSVYVAPVLINTSAALRAMARLNGVNGPVAVASYVIAPFAPTINPSSGTYVGSVQVTLGAQTGATIFYTLDGSEPTTSSTVYSAPFAVAQSATVRAMARLNNVNGPVASATYTIAPFAPEILPASGTYVGPVSVRIAAQPGATIFFTLDGTQPTTSSQVYTAAFSVSNSTTVIAMARLNGVNGPASSASYVIAPFAPEISPAGGTFVGSVQVSVTAQAGAAIHYTLDGSDPTAASPVYTGPVTVSASATFKAMARANGVNSPVASVVYTIAPLAPSISPSPGTYVGPINVTISAAPGASIFFTTDGSEPMPTSSLYSGPFQLASSATVKAMARANGVNGPVATAAYVIAPLAPQISPAQGTYAGQVTVSISAQPGALIFYTLDGSDPTTASQVFSGPFVLSQDATVKAMARLNGVNGPVATAAFVISEVVIEDPKPRVRIAQISPTELQVTFPASIAGVYYQLQQSGNLSAWTNTGLPLEGNGTNLAWTVPLQGGSRFFRVVVGVRIVAAPAIQPAGGIHTGSTMVTLEAEAGAEIFYTLDGSEPNLSSTRYTAPFLLTQSTSIRALAVLDGIASAVASVNITINPPPAPAPRLSVASAPDNQFDVTLTFPVPGQFYQLQATTNLVTWTDVATPQTTTGTSITWRVPAVTSTLFFRAVAVAAPLPPPVPETRPSLSVAAAPGWSIRRNPAFASLRRVLSTTVE